MAPRKKISGVAGTAGACALLSGLVLLFSCASLADTVILKDDTRVKGLIIDEMKDRIVISTVDGEKVLMKSDIRSAVYDDEERALLQIGRNQFKRGQYFKAYSTYEKAAELNPDSEEAREKRDYLRSYLETKTRYDIEDGVRRKRENFSGDPGPDPVRMVRESLGLVLVPGERYVTVTEVIKRRLGASPMPFRPGDRVISVWSETAAYLTPEEVAEMLLRPGETRMVIERTVVQDIPSRTGLAKFMPFNSYKNAIGAELKFMRQGLTVMSVSSGGPFAKAGILDGDLVYRIGGKNTRYLPFKDVEGIIEKSAGRELEVVVQRDVTVWKKD